MVMLSQSPDEIFLAEKPVDDYSNQKNGDEIPENLTDERPLGVKVLAILLIIQGIALILTEIILGVRIYEIMIKDDVPVLTLFIWYNIWVVVSLFGGMGLTSRDRSGWWVGTYYFYFMFHKNAMNLYNVIVLGQEFGITDSDIQLQAVKFIIRNTFNILCIIYLYRRRVLSFFGFENLSRLKATLILIGVNILLFILGSIFTPVDFTEWAH